MQALGIDAYTLIQQLPKMKIISDYSIQGQTGILSVNNQCVIQRKMTWAKHGL
ncbi:hypothetical protein O1U_0228 [Candidatus Photodesmus katoptron Akat1]|uniref:Uncharacterized protein n=1 Tax=Candidatus Photodesmus katoptron Akat1 TaxID=1236703 RepID=S3DH46_9GAMM|nr:hypothetical protein O1U_0228 [Candidatus Photodesmus katoptron Akat1]